MTLCLICLSYISVFAGYSGFITFLIFKNYQASIWCFATGLTGSILVQIHWLRYKNRISEYYTASSLWSLAWIGFSMFALGISGFIYNLIIFFVLHPPLLPIKDSTVLSIVWCFLTFKTGVLLFFYARKYAHYVQIDRTKLIQPDNPGTSSQSQQI